MIEEQVAENGNYRVIFSGWEKEAGEEGDKDGSNEGR